ncbi:hypothetical protein DFH27DRAFT_607042 [Peziza echinospora]|nr:hypothetical protein DFH27DRAFT_607042 [Peziza echinospora]
MNAWERKGIAKAERDLERKERKRHNANLRKSAITDVEYKSAARQAGYKPEDTNAFRIIYTTRDDQHEEEILRTHCKSAMEADNPVFDNYQSIHTTGTFFVWDKASDQIVLGVQVTPVQSNPDNNSSMDSIEEKSSTNANAAEFGFFFQHIMRDSKLHAKIHSNGAQISGEMWAMGWRGGYEAGVPFDKYVYPENGKRKSEWEALRKNDYGIHSFYGTRFCSFAPALFASTQQISHLQSVPLWGHEFIVQHNDPDVQDYCFASNLTYTMSNRAGITFISKNGVCLSSLIRVIRVITAKRQTASYNVGSRTISVITEAVGLCAL